MLPYTDNMAEAWPFSRELKLVKGLGKSAGKTDLKNYQPDLEIPDEIEELVFKKMKKGVPLDDMNTARQILRDLEEMGSVTKPRFPQAVWQVTVHDIV